MTPFSTLPGRKMACPRGRRLRSGLRDVEVARPSSSRRQKTIRLAPPLFQFSRKIRWVFGSTQPGSRPLGRARMVKALISRKICVQNVRRVFQDFRGVYASEPPIQKKLKNVVSVGTFLRLYIFFWPQKFTFWPQPIFYPLFLNEDSKSAKIVLASCIIEFKDIQV
jgi:hypothetical protein